MGRSDRVPRRLVCETDLPETCSSNQGQEISVNILKHAGLTLVQLARQIISLPQTITKFFKQRRLQVILVERETERLDRIRNPDKYRGK